ncbi:MAG: hypothetical protein KAS75_00250 [Planctomycetes bacterium]|nr:hypothetical protein [Planctomycetota bacterium]
MKKLLILILAFGVVSVTTGQIALKVYEADGETLFDGNDIMVGTELRIVVSSDSNDYWSGGLFITGQDRLLGDLAARGLDPNTRDWTDSHYEQAGDLAKVTAWEDSWMWGLDMYTSDINDSNFVAGDWFIIDYYADEVGDCNIGVYDYSISWDDPNCFLEFSHVRNRDLNFDDKVNFIDFVLLASQWNATDCNDPNWCDGLDLDEDGYVDVRDLELFNEYWLWGVSDTEPNEDPNELDDPNEIYPEDPNVIYSIIDVNGANEITIGVNDSITLYIDMVTLDEYDIIVFEVEVGISDISLGSIDNTEYDSNNPPGPGTARILVGGRYFDYWGPGINQQEGILLSGASPFSGLIPDGHLASFVFTCKGEGDVTLELTNDRWPYPKLEGITIHQVGPNSQPLTGEGMSTIPESEQFLLDQEIGTDELYQEVSTDELNQEVDIDGLVETLEDLWKQDSDIINDLIGEEEWNEFLNSLENP